MSTMFSSSSTPESRRQLRALKSVGSSSSVLRINYLTIISVSLYLLVVVSKPSNCQKPAVEEGDVGLQQEGKPCICNSNFFKQCPPARLCMENRPDLLLSTLKPLLLTNADHDDLDPDHVDPPVMFNLSPDKAAHMPSSIIPGGELQGVKLSSSSSSSVDNYESNRRTRHRKVYVARRQGDNYDDRPPIHTIKVRIPVAFKDLSLYDIPEPPPLYKLKKYTSYESVPETKMVPVTKTIIKPVNLTRDQVIGDKSELFPKK